MSLNSTSLAPAVGSSVTNVQFVPAAQNVPRKILVAGTHLSSITDAAEGIPVQVFSSADAGSQFGLGSMIERLVYRAFT
jgi:phage tail sheath gpL-like